MGLLDLADVAPLLVCPRCHSPLEESSAGFVCTSDACALSAPASFPLVERWPHLVDFENSILERPRETAAAPPGSLKRWSVDRLPRGLRRVWKPRNQVAEENVETLLGLCGAAPVLLVIGGGTVGNGVEAIYEDPQTRVLALDIFPTPAIQLVADAHQLPVASNSVDAVLIQAVLEHVLNPGQVVAEIHRVLKESGLVYAETPFLQPVHAGAYDFTRYTGSGHRYLFRAFDEVAAGPVAGPGSQMLASVDHLVRGLLRSELAGKVARALFFWLRYLDRLIPDAFAMDSASAYFFLGRRVNRELSARDIVGYYAGAQRAD